MTGSLVSLDASRAPGDIVTKVLSDEACRRSVEELLDAARASAQRLLRANRHVVVALRDALLERDELIGDEIALVIASATAHAGLAWALPVPPVPAGGEEVIDVRPQTASHPRTTA